jgi:hypothetical protein
MEYIIASGEPCGMSCDKCGESEYDTFLAEDINGEQVGLCAACALKIDLDEECFEKIEKSVRMELSEQDYQEHESGWSVEGRFGHFLVQFDTRRADAMKQTAVDHFKSIGKYTELKGKGTVSLESPETLKTEIKVPKDSYRKEGINEERDMNARSR